MVLIITVGTVKVQYLILSFFSMYQVILEGVPLRLSQICSKNSIMLFILTFMLQYEQY